jgi:hypothetical protein
MNNLNLIKILQAGDNEIEKYYLQYFNDFLTVDKFAEYNNLSLDGANLIVNQGRTVNINKVPIKLNITRKDFINWYYINISAKERFDLMECIYNEVTESLLNYGETLGFTVEELFNSLDLSQIESIPLSHVSGHNEIDGTMQLFELEYLYKLSLKD